LAAAYVRGWGIAVFLTFVSVLMGGFMFYSSGLSIVVLALLWRLSSVSIFKFLLG
jgi:hypothetical protein